MDLQFGDIQETALIPLAIKASETARQNARIKDEKASEIIEALGVDVSKYDPFMSHEGVVARTIMFRDVLIKLLKKYPDALCINLGCGFDDKFSQVDNGRLIWFDVDLPDQIAVRRKVYEDRERCTMLDGSALEGEWTQQLPKNNMNIIVMEGVLEYFSKEQVKTCLIDAPIVLGHRLCKILIPVICRITCCPYHHITAVMVISRGIESFVIIVIQFYVTHPGWL